jgi:hypothetical protein
MDLIKHTHRYCMYIYIHMLPLLYMFECPLFKMFSTIILVGHFSSPSSLSVFHNGPGWTWARLTSGYRWI